VLRAAYAVWNEGGPEAMAREVWSPDFVYHFAPEFPGGGEVRGAQAVARHVADTWVSSFGIGTMTVVRAWSDPAGGLVLVEMTLGTKGEASGVELEAPFFQLARMKEGRPVECWDYLSRDQAFEAAAHHV
jgi:ketosteroid isomerase-like protein